MILRFLTIQSSVLSADDVTIFADEAVRVSFENAHDGRPNGGYGVKNNFKLDENKQYQYTGDNVSTD